MKNKKKQIVVTGGIFIIFFFTVGGYFINKYYHNRIRTYPKMYCYEYFRNGEKPVSVLIIENLKLKEHYLQYYRELEEGNEPYLNNDIPLKGMPQYSPVYVIDYTNDSLLAEVVSYYDKGGRFGGSYIRGWVYAKTLHKEPPSK